jgi:hypothetical protein
MSFTRPPERQARWYPVIGGVEDRPPAWREAIGAVPVRLDETVVHCGVQFDQAGGIEEGDQFGGAGA